MIPVRDDQPRFSTPYVTYFLIALNSVIFLFEASLTPDSFKTLLFQLGMVPANITGYLSGSGLGLVGVLLPAFTSMFLHGSWMHVIGNMWFLWIFGDNIEDYLGHFKYLIFYLTSGLAAAFGPGAAQPAFACTHGRRQWSYRRGSRRLLRSVPEGSGADLVPDLFLLLPAGVGDAGLLVRNTVRQRCGNFTRIL